jgi:hypothetical protein
MRYKKSALAMIGLDSMSDELYDIATECDEIRWFMDDEETLIDALDGDSEEAWEFKMLFSDLSNKCEELSDFMRDEYVTEYFDDFFVSALGNRYSIIGYDVEEQDYFNLSGFDTDLAQKESGKRIMRRTKEELVAISAQCFGLLVSFLDIHQKYDYLKVSFDILKGVNKSVLDAVKAIETAYSDAEKSGFDLHEITTKEFDKFLSALPEQCWLE